ncbi:MAG TPA: hypothetical protein VD766_10500, partial [Solirubrobacterales bacterium]|nr:hypothetical protein [Solirubrobacterales bacterium]
MNFRRSPHPPAVLLAKFLGCIALVAPFVATSAAQAASPPTTCDQTKPTFKTSSTSGVVVASCTANVPAGSTVLIHATSGLTVTDSSYEARYGIGIDTTSPDSASVRYANVSSSADDSSAATTLTKTGLAAGTHTFNLIVSRFDTSFYDPAGPGPVSLVAPSISVIVIPPESDLRTCSAQNPQSNVTSSSDMTTVISCTIDADVPGNLVTIANGWMAKQEDSDGLQDRPEQEYEAAVEVAVGAEGNAPTPVDDSTRFINVYQDGGGEDRDGDGTDKSASTQAVSPVAAGSYTVHYRMSKFSDDSVGPGPVVQFNPTLSVIFVPDGSPDGAVCHDEMGSSGFSTTSRTAVE